MSVQSIRLSPAGQSLARRQPLRANVKRVPFRYQASLFLLFFGSGMVPFVNYLNLRWSLGLDGFLLDRINLIVCIPAVICGAPLYFKHGRFATSFALIALYAWITMTILWVDPTERGRSLIGLATLFITLPLAALVNATGLFRYCAYSFTIAYLGGALAVQGSGPDMSAGRWGDFIEAGLTVMNSNEIGFLAACAAILMYGVWSTPVQRGSSNTRVQPSKLPVILGAAACGLAMMTVSRSACASLIMAGSGVWMHHAKKTVAIVVATPILLTLVLIGAVFVGLGDRWQTRLGDSDTGTFNGRTEIWEAIGAVQHRLGWNWVWGIGLAGIDKELGEELGEGAIHPIDGIRRMHSHNLYLEWVAELGLVGVILSFSLMISAIRAGLVQGYIDKSPWRLAFFLALAVFSIAGVPTKVQSFPAIGALLWASLSPSRGSVEGAVR